MVQGCQLGLRYTHLKNTVASGTARLVKPGTLPIALQVTRYPNQFPCRLCSETMHFLARFCTSQQCAPCHVKACLLHHVVWGRAMLARPISPQNLFLAPSSGQEFAFTGNSEMNPSLPSYLQECVDLLGARLKYTSMTARFFFVDHAEKVRLFSSQCKYPCKILYSFPCKDTPCKILLYLLARKCHSGFPCKARAGCHT